MPSPFPGMDPYLENPDIWPDVHLSMLVGVAYDLDVDYGTEPVPALDPDDAAWTDALLRDKGLRN